MAKLLADCQLASGVCGRKVLLIERIVVLHWLRFLWSAAIFAFHFISEVDISQVDASNIAISIVQWRQVLVTAEDVGLAGLSTLLTLTTPFRRLIVLALRYFTELDCRVEKRLTVTTVLQIYHIILGQL